MDLLLTTNLNIFFFPLRTVTAVMLTCVLSDIPPNFRPGSEVLSTSYMHTRNEKNELTNAVGLDSLPEFSV